MRPNWQDRSKSHAAYRSRRCHPTIRPPPVPTGTATTASTLYLRRGRGAPLAEDSALFSFAINTLAALGSAHDVDLGLLSGAPTWRDRAVNRWGYPPGRPDG